MVAVAGVEPACLLFSQGASFCILIIVHILIYTALPDNLNCGIF